MNKQQKERYRIVMNNKQQIVPHLTFKLTYEKKTYA